MSSVASSASDAASIRVFLPDGKELSLPSGASGMDAALAIGPGLAAAALSIKVNGEFRDLTTPLPDGAQISILTNKSPDALPILRHSCAHLLAQAVLRLFPEAQFEDGPPTEDGFFYDIKTNRPLTLEDFPAIEAEMKKCVAEKHPFKRREVSRDEAADFFKSRGQDMKLSIISAIPDGQVISLYEQGEFTDLCRGTHVPHTGVFKAFQLHAASGAYWKGDASTGVQLTRVRGYCFFTEKELKEHVSLLEEAKRRDHRKLGRELELFMFHEYAPGATFWLPKGKQIFDLLRNRSSDLHRGAGYQEVFTPMLFKKDLFMTSGHWQNYRENMFTVEADETEYALKPMNCPSHMLIFRERRRSYRELPLRIFDQGVLHRNEASGTLSGLTRVRQFCQDDSHIFLTPNLIAEEITRVIGLARRVYKAFGMDFSAVYLSTRPEKNFLGEVETWNAAEAALEEAIKGNGLEYQVNKGDGAFYGPKIDFIVRDALKRDWQTATIQLDYQLPQRFELRYIDADNTEKCPIVVHRALYGSFERFMGILIEHFAGSFPFWLSPEQVRVLTISEKFLDYGQSVLRRLHAAGIRATFDDRDDKLSYKIREAQIQKVPYMLVCGQKEQESDSVSVRTREGGDQGSQPVAAFLERLKVENDIVI